MGKSITFIAQRWQTATLLPTGVKNRTLIACKWKIGAAQKKLIKTFHTHLLKI